MPVFFLKVTGTDFREPDEQNQTHRSNLAKISLRNANLLAPFQDACSLEGVTGPFSRRGLHKRHRFLTCRRPQRRARSRRSVRFLRFHRGLEPIGTRRGVDHKGRAFEPKGRR